MPRSRSAHPSPSRKARGAGELALIERIRQRAAAAGGRSPALRLGIGDDCAIVAPPAGHEIVITTDMSLEAKHFRRDWHPPQAVGHRALARGLSDLAAMGARPLAAFLSLALPRSLSRDTRWLDGFLDGLFALASEHAVPLAGGDTAESPSEQVLVDIVALGSVPRGKALRRSGARADDVLYCTGALGGAAAELQGLASSSPHRPRRSANRKDHPHLYPQPRLAVGQALVRRGLATACIDLSDGLSTDLMHLCQASSVAAEVDAKRLPIHPLARALGPERALDSALNGGEDYELLFTAPADARVPRAIAGVAISPIGRMLRPGRSRPTMTLVDAQGRRELEPRGWEHLR